MIEVTDAQIVLEDVWLKYKTRSGMFQLFEHTVLSGISLKLRRGETLGVLGTNGCGKSSLLKILAGIIDPTSGVVKCSKDTKRALLALGLGFRPDLSGRDNALISAMLQGIGQKKALTLLPDIHEFSELSEFFDQPVKTYSAGMRARLGFATALKIEVDILLIDEILGVGDAHFRDKAQNAIINKIAGNQTVVFVSHNPGQIKKICGRAIWLDKGKIREQGSAKDVSDSYQQYIKQLNK
jgi:lipopolysaccharide transport system ATP-binding protein